MSKALRLVLISDTHNLHEHFTIPEGDILIHAGDLTRVGDIEDLRRFNRWVGALPHRHKLVIAGNHDFCLEREPKASEALLTNCIYLRDSGIVLEGIRFYGSPWQPWFFDWAFNLQRGLQIKAKWDLIPADTNVLITHGPPRGYGDKTIAGDLAGCHDLLNTVRTIRPRLHVYGHIHEGYGVIKDGPTTFVNASSCDVDYHPINPAIVFNLEVASEPE